MNAILTGATCACGLTFDRFQVRDGDYRRHLMKCGKNAAVPVCETCDGSGTVRTRPPHCPHGGHRCECGFDEQDCPDCASSGSTKCEDGCGLPAAVMVGDDALCPMCADLRLSEREAAYA